MIIKSLLSQLFLGIPFEGFLLDFDDLRPVCLLRDDLVVPLDHLLGLLMLFVEALHRFFELLHLREHFVIEGLHLLILGIGGQLALDMIDDFFLGLFVYVASEGV